MCKHKGPFALTSACKGVRFFWEYNVNTGTIFYNNMLTVQVVLRQGSREKSEKKQLEPLKLTVTDD